MPDVIEMPNETTTQSETEALKWEFLNIVFLSNAIAAALGHNKTYAPTATDENKNTLRRELSSAMVGQGVSLVQEPFVTTLVGPMDGQSGPLTNQPTSAFGSSHSRVWRFPNSIVASYFSGLF